MTTQQIKKELAKRNVIIYSVRKNGNNGYNVDYALQLSENSISTSKNTWVEEKVDLLNKFA